MEPIRKFIGRFSMLMAVVTFISCVLSGISLPTSILRSVEVYLGMIFIFVITLKVLRWGLLATASSGQENQVEQKSE